jgi:hypothetical protein
VAGGRLGEAAKSRGGLVGWLPPASAWWGVQYGKSVQGGGGDVDAPALVKKKPYHEENFVRGQFFYILGVIYWKFFRWTYLVVPILFDDLEKLFDFEKKFLKTLGNIFLNAKRYLLPFSHYSG